MARIDLSSILMDSVLQEIKPGHGLWNIYLLFIKLNFLILYLLVWPGWDLQLTLGAIKKSLKVNYGGSF